MSHFVVAVFSMRPEDVDMLLSPFDENTEDGEYLEWVSDEDSDFNEERNENGYISNPNAKWDWYEIGGRWNGALRMKNSDRRSNQAQVKDVDFSPESDEYRHALRFWEVNVEGQPLRDDEKLSDFFCICKPEYYRERYGAKECYAQSCSEFLTWAHITPEGEWVEQGEMGWFGVGKDTKESISNYRKDLKEMIEENPDLWITIVDCHI